MSEEAEGSQDGFGFDQWPNRHVQLDTGREAYFGRDVLAGLVAGLEAAVTAPRTRHRWGPAALGCAMWMDDPLVVELLGRMSNVCVVVTKQQAYKYRQPQFASLVDLADRCGLAPGAYPELSEIAPAVDGEPALVGPSTPMWSRSEDSTIPAVRELGFRRTGGTLVPIVHAKLMLVGRMGWTDEHPSGAVVDELFFVPERLWVGSANFTASSRRSLEMGMWTSDVELMMAARRFLLDLVAHSEPLGSGSDVMDPELVPVDYDAVAMSEAIYEMNHEID